MPGSNKPGPLSTFKPAKAGSKLSGYAFVNLSGDGQFEICPLPEKPFAIGRDEANDIVVDDEPVSKRHARLTFANNEITLWDVGSKNGTFVNGERITNRKLTPGDVVAVARARLIFVKGVRPDGSLLGALAPSGVQAGAQAAFTAKSGLKPGEKCYLGNAPLFVGREKYNNVVVGDPSVSPYHAQIAKSGDEVRIQDLNSSEGVQVNGAKVDMAVLAPDDTITIGSLTLFCDEILGKRGTGKAKPVAMGAGRAAAGSHKFAADETIITGEEKAGLGAALLRELEDKAAEPGAERALAPAKPVAPPPVRRPTILKLTCLAGPVKGKSYPIRNRPLIIGRNPTSDIFLEELSVSREHAHIRPAGDRVEIVDAGSRNGVEVNGKRVKSQELHPGDKIGLGTCTFLVEIIEG